MTAATCFPQASARAGLMGWLSACILVLPAPSGAMPMNERIERQERVSLQGALLKVSVSESQAEALATAGSRTGPGAWADSSNSARQRMVWLQSRRSALALGLGVEQRGPYRGGVAYGPSENTGFQPAGMLLGLSLDTGARSRLILQTPLLTAPRSAADEALLPAPERELRMGMVFHASKPYADLRRGLRVELSGQTTLSFRPRSGRIAVALQSSW